MRPRKRHQLTATIYDKRGKIVAVGHNNYNKTHPYQACKAQQAGLPQKIYLHAEIDAIIKALRSGVDLHKISIERYDKLGQPRDAMPCPVCQIAIREAGIKFIEYTIG